MLHLRVFADRVTADRVTAMLASTPGIRHIARNDAATDALDTLLTADVAPAVADDVLQALRSEGIPQGDAYFVRVETIELNDPADGTSLDHNDGDHVAWSEVIGIASAYARPTTRYLAAMAAAGVIAVVGVSTANEILIVGAMAVSPDLLPLAAICVGLVARRPRLAGRALLTLIAGFLTAGIAAAATGVLLDWTGFLDQNLGSGGLGTLTTTDLTTVLVAFAAGVAGMLAFETRAAAAVGVAISVTTIPALAYFAAAAVIGDTNDAWGAFLVLVTNVAILIVSAALTLWSQQLVRTRAEDAAHPD